MISKVLIANRGEIACRIIRTVKKLGLSSVAVYSNADANALHVSMADEAIHIGESVANASYLDYNKVIQAALATGADAIHPGYGFLSENAGFAKACSDNGLNFIGPPVASIEAMGSKSAAKEIMQSAGVPLLSGYHGDNQNPDFLQQEAAKIGYPVLLKAAAGGGGKGMRIVHEVADFENQMQRAVSEATNSFGNGAVFVEKYVQNPRHIEIQVLADEHGNVVHLFERECSIQRRHQKVIEEAPSVVLTAELRKAMGEAAVNVAKACDYRGAGTVEFIFEPGGKFYFLEMNTRLQVEHPVTEQITGIDLVKAQIQIAQGEVLPFTQGDLKIQGHAIEVRVYAEDAAANFMPGTGTLREYRRPQGLGVRVDDGLEQGMEVSIYYDPMIAKLITFGANRSEAIARMKRAMSEYRISGVQTTIDFAQFVMDHEAFVSGDFDTHFVANYYTPEALDKSNAELEAIGAMALSNLLQTQKETQSTSTSNGQSRWKQNRS